MKYVIIGAGGTGGILGAYMTKAGKDVTLIARGEHLTAIQNKGLKLEKLWDNSSETIPVRAFHMDEYQEQPDVILVCVKSYSIGSIIPFIQQISGKHTVVIPILNVFGTGEKLQKMLPNILVTDGCIYVSAYIRTPGVLCQHSPILRVVYGTRRAAESIPALNDIYKDFHECGIDGVLSENVQRDCMQKFSYVSPVGAASLYFNATAGDFSKEGAPRTMLKALIREILALAEAMELSFDNDLVKTNLAILASLPPEATTSMQRDVMEGKQSEIDGLIFEVVRLGEKYAVPVPEYQKVADKFAELKKNPSMDCRSSSKPRNRAGSNGHRR